ncbi:hypothetical protein BDN72DRAFT_903272 [Pluteus cervinus]|uniref:Uncharacterized protein n=1 Tax=Pluteus cervinus TaxID=181527 RepID=A0ACD3AA36_9AGAR|nr:hypothetical protein BDN72DRAFT_903272 [Pluteus cervinus]
MHIPLVRLPLPELILKQQRRILLPHLPAEIWILILRSATEVKGLVSEELIASDFVSASYQGRNRHLKRVLNTKTAVVRVCKQWHIWAIPFLYESIIVDRGKDLRSLRTTLRTVPSVVGREYTSQPVLSFNRPFGQWTKRFDVLLNDNTSYGSHQDAKHVSDIIRCFPRLQSLTFNMCLGPFISKATPIIEAIASTCGSSLRILNWFPNEYNHQIDLLDLTGLLLRTPNLRALNCPTYTSPGTPMKPRWYDLPDPLSPIILNHLTSISFTPEYLGENPLFPVYLTSSKLNHVILSGRGDPSSLGDFLGIYGSSLTHIQYSQKLGPSFDDHDLSLIMITLKSCCPKLTRLDLRLNAWVTLEEDLNLPGTLETLGLCTRLELRNPVYKERDCLHLLWALDTMRMVGGEVRLNVVRIVDELNVVDLKGCRKVFEGVVKKVEEMGARFEDHEGGLLECIP